MPKKGRAYGQTRETALRLAREGWITSEDLQNAEGIRQTSAAYQLVKMMDAGLLVRKRVDRHFEYTTPENSGSLPLEMPRRRNRPRGRGVAVAKHVDKTQRLEKAMAILFPQGIHDIQGLVSWMDLTRELMNG